MPGGRVARRVELWSGVGVGSGAGLSEQQRIGINLRSNHFLHPLLIINNHHYNLQKESSIVTGPISGGLNLLGLLFVFKFAFVVFHQLGITVEDEHFPYHLWFLHLISNCCSRPFLWRA